MSKSVTVKIQYTQEEIDRQFIKTGVKRNFFSSADMRKLSIDDMTTDQRADLLALGWNTSSLGPGSLIHRYEISKRYITNQPELDHGANVGFDHVPTDEELLALMSELAEEKRQLLAEVAALMPAWRIENKARKDALALKAIEDARLDEEREERKQAEREQQRLAAITINWQDDGTALHELSHALSVVSGLSYDQRWSNWTKEITGIDRTQKNGYMYDGEFVKDGTHELTLGERRVFLVAATTGSNKYRTMNYQVVELTADGTLIKHDISDNDDKPGWALRMRDAIAALLETEQTEPMVHIPAHLAQRIQIALSLNDEELATELNLLIRS